METLSFFLEEEEGSKWFLRKTHKVLSRVYNRKSVQLPYGFYNSHLDRMTTQSAVSMLSCERTAAKRLAFAT